VCDNVHTRDAPTVSLLVPIRSSESAPNILWNDEGHAALMMVAAEWPVALIRRTLVVSATSAIALSLPGIRGYGTLAMAAGMSVGALLLNGQAIWSAYSLAGSRTASWPRGP
jgi:hypothetical protein